MYKTAETTKSNTSSFSKFATRTYCKITNGKRRKLLKYKVNMKQKNTKNDNPNRHFSCFFKYILSYNRLKQLINSNVKNLCQDSKLDVGDEPIPAFKFQAIISANRYICFSKYVQFANAIIMQNAKNDSHFLTIVFYCGNIYTLTLINVKK